MKLDALNTDHLNRAIEIYAARAWHALEAPQPLPSFPPGEPIERYLDRFIDETHEIDQTVVHHFVLRLGNDRYPHMKFVLQEFLEADAYLFRVDAHDAFEIDPAAPDYERWCDLKRSNSELARAIEADWSAAGLPTMTSLKEVAGRVAVAPGQGQGRRILIVDDETEICEALTLFLRKCGYRVEVAHDGATGLLKAADGAPEIVLLDHMLPDGDGKALAPRFKDAPGPTPPKVILMTAAPIDCQHGEGFDAFLIKPFHHRVLLARIAELTEPSERRP